MVGKRRIYVENVLEGIIYDAKNILHNDGARACITNIEKRLKKLMESENKYQTLIWEKDASRRKTPEIIEYDPIQEIFPDGYLNKLLNYNGGNNAK